MKYRKAEKKDFESLAKLHLKSFNDFFLTSLGYGFLKTYYQTSLKSTDSIAVCAVNEKNEIIGFGIGCIKSKGYHKNLILNNFTTFAIQTFQIIFTNPKAIIRLFNNLDKNSNKDDDGNYAELLSIAVSPEHKGLGIGKELINTFEAEAKSKGCKKIALTTDFNNNEQVVSFYRNVGYAVLYEFTAYPDRKMYKLIKEIN
jgi:ribosomal protein S18 acetylase RimI-like enzyme